MVSAKDFIVFRAGDYPQGKFTEQDLDEMVSTFNAEDAPHIIIGHSSDYKGKSMIPSFGQILGGLKRVGQDLIATGAEFADKLAEWMEAGYYKQRSVEIVKQGGKNKLFRLGILGASPPQVRGLPSMDETLDEVVGLQFSEAEPAIEFSEPLKDAAVIEFNAVEEVEKLGKEDTKKTVTECLAELNESLMEMIDKDEKRDRMNQEIWEHLDDVFQCLDLHKSFIEKLEAMEEKSEGESAEMSAPWWKKILEFARKVTAPPVVEQKPDTSALEAKIAELEAKVKEFTDQAAAKAETERLEAEAAQRAQEQAAIDAKRAEVKEFCDTAIKENRMTPAMRETDEPIMFDLAQTNVEALKSFQQKYSKPIVPVGEVTAVNENKTDTRMKIFKDAEGYIKLHPKEFAGLTPEQSVSKVLFEHSTGKIQFTNTKE